MVWRSNIRCEIRGGDMSAKNKRGLIAAASNKKDSSFEFTPNLVSKLSGVNYMGHFGDFGPNGALMGSLAGQGRLYKINTDGSFGWAKYKQNGDSGVFGIAAHGDYFYLLACSYDEFEVACIDSDGNHVWSTKIVHETVDDNIYPDENYMRISVSDAGIVICGVGIYAGNDDWFMMSFLDLDGNLNWQKKINVTGWSGVNGTFAVSITKNAIWFQTENRNISKSFCVMRIDLDGSYDWMRSYTITSGQNGSFSYGRSIIEHGGNVYIAQQTGGDSSGVLLIKINALTGALITSVLYAKASVGKDINSPKIAVNNDGVFLAGQYHNGSKNIGIAAMFDHDFTEVYFMKDLNYAGGNVDVGTHGVRAWENGAGFFLRQGAGAGPPVVMITTDFTGANPAFTAGSYAGGTFTAVTVSEASLTPILAAQTPTVTDLTITYTPSTAPTLSTTW